MRSTKGITLIALIITIIVLVILVGVTISTLFGTDGILTKAREGADTYSRAATDELDELSKLEDWLDGDHSLPRLPDLPLETEETKKMVTKWNIKNGDTIKLTVYLNEEDIVDFTIDWGDSQVENIIMANLQYDYWGNRIYFSYIFCYKSRNISCN